MGKLVKWNGERTSLSDLLELTQSPLGMWPLLKPEGNGVQEDGSLRFTNCDGYIEIARPGDAILVDDDGWLLDVKKDDSLDNRQIEVNLLGLSYLSKGDRTCSRTNTPSRAQGRRRGT